jgi:hypothetical protein
MNNDWGWEAAANGALSGAMWGFGYTKGVEAAGISPLSYAGQSAISSTVNYAMPSTSVPITDKFSINASPAFGLGPNGLTGGFNMTGMYSNGDLSIAAGIGAGDNYWGWNAFAAYAGWGGGYGRTTYSSTEVFSKQLGTQNVATYTFYFNHNSFSISNDKWGDKHDRWRTSAAELTIGNWSIGTYLYTNDGEDASNEWLDKSENCVPPWPVGRNKNDGKSTWTNGRPYYAPLWVGYRNGNQITRAGISREWVHNMTQNLVHKQRFGNQNYYMSYDEFRRGTYFYSGYRNPLSIWDR